jgi:hypothetical protein
MFSMFFYSLGNMPGMEGPDRQATFQKKQPAKGFVELRVRVPLWGNLSFENTGLAAVGKMESLRPEC